MTQDNITPEELVKELRDCEDDCMECQIAVREVSCLALATAADLIEQQAARIAELEAKAPRWIPVTERLPKKGEDGSRDSDWVRCIVSVIWTYGSNFADGDAGTHMFSAPAMFDVDQKIWHVGTEPAEFTVNALIPLEDSYGDFFVTHWMPYPKLPQEGT